CARALLRYFDYW
nr:immunoglobulin heavy chain junction region [Mus musculus]